ncbi:MAG: hypothetical protein IPK60_02820 [Sandaracinaceae bacterium]|nr:hypothetical protein [Sandaracinaceae bacterium]
MYSFSWSHLGRRALMLGLVGSALTGLAGCMSSGDERTVGVSQGYAVPGRPTGIAPTGNIMTNNPTYQWTPPAGGADTYRLWVDDGSAPHVIDEVFTEAAAGCVGGVGTCSVTASTTIAGGVGYWWVLGTNGDGDGQWSAGVSFTYAQNLVATLISPTGTIVDSTPTYSWNALVGGSTYRLYVSDPVGGFGYVDQTFTAAAAGCASGMGVCSVTPVTVLNPGAGTWWIQTNGGGGQWSSGMSYNLDNTCPGGCDDGQPCTDDVCDPMVGCVSTSDATNTCDDGNACTTGDQCNARGICLASDYNSCRVTTLGPTGNDVGQSPTFTWQGIAGVTTYRLYAIDGQNLGSLTGGAPAVDTQVTAAAAGCPGGVGTCSFAPPVTFAPGRAAFWVQTPPFVDGEQSGYQHGPWSSQLDFTNGISTRPVGLTPTGVQGTQTPTYTWSPIVGSGTTYMLWVSNAAGTTLYTEEVSENAVGCAGGSGTCSLTPAMAIPTGSNYWWVQANPHVGIYSAQGLWSTGVNFTSP